MTISPELAKRIQLALNIGAIHALQRGILPDGNFIMEVADEMKGVIACPQQSPLPSAQLSSSMTTS